MIRPLLFFLIFLFCSPYPLLAQDAFSVLRLRIQGSINPAQEDILREALTAAQSADHNLLLIQLDTPGGLGETTRNMVKLIHNAPLPVAIWVGPDGSRAASAGVFLVAASNIAAMSPYSNIGSASPVSVGGEEMSDTMSQKILNDFLSLVRSSAQRHDRNVDWYLRAVTESANLTGSEAVMERVVDFVAVSVPDLLEQIGVHGFEQDGKVIYFSSEQLTIDTYEPGLWYTLLSWMLDPQIAYFLLMGGLAGIFFELTNPGTIFPGVFGGLCLLLGLYALSILPTNVAGLLLILFGLLLFGLELVIASYGLLSLAAVIALFFGSLILFRYEYGLGGIPLTSIAITTISLSLFILVCIYLVAKAHKTKPFTGAHTLEGQRAQVKQWSKTQGIVHLQGENWSAMSPMPLHLNPDDIVVVTDVDGLMLHVTKTEPSNIPGGS